jgi:hypothetical protein
MIRNSIIRGGVANRNAPPFWGGVRGEKKMYDTTSATAHFESRQESESQLTPASFGFEPYSNLIRDLESYGLNPFEWQITLSTSNQYWLVHREDPDFQLEGKTDTESANARWLSLRIISL